MAQEIVLTVNGQSRSVTTDPARPLLEVLREDFDLTGTKYGCGEGRCGACTVLIDGRAEHACLVPVGDVAGKQVTTIEGLAAGDALHPVQEAFLTEDALQCGYCTPGMIMGVVGLLKAHPKPSEAEVRTAMEGHICRCCGYPRIELAVRRAIAAGRNPS
jgi:aerobic-type carbon monoxide dehydrogenase small subunit (CoxS/CutS family)